MSAPTQSPRQSGVSAADLSELFGIAEVIASTTGHEEDLEWAAKFRKARSAVAELLEARARDLEVLELAKKRLQEAAIREKAKWPRLHLANAMQACEDRIAILTAALARCTGEGA